MGTNDNIMVDFDKMPSGIPMQLTEARNDQIQYVQTNQCKLKKSMHTQSWRSFDVSAVIDSELDNVKGDLHIADSHLLPFFLQLYQACRNGQTMNSCMDSRSMFLQIQKVFDNFAADQNASETQHSLDEIDSFWKWDEKPHIEAGYTNNVTTKAQDYAPDVVDISMDSSPDEKARCNSGQSLSYDKSVSVNNCDLMYNVNPSINEQLEESTCDLLNLDSNNGINYTSCDTGKLDLNSNDINLCQNSNNDCSSCLSDSDEEAAIVSHHISDQNCALYNNKISTFSESSSCSGNECLSKDMHCSPLSINCMLNSAKFRYQTSEDDAVMVVCTCLEEVNILKDMKQKSPEIKLRRQKISHRKRRMSTPLLFYNIRDSKHKSQESSRLSSQHETTELSCPSLEHSSIDSRCSVSRMPSPLSVDYKDGSRTPSPEPEIHCDVHNKDGPTPDRDGLHVHALSSANESIVTHESGCEDDSINISVTPIILQSLTEHGKELNLGLPQLINFLLHLYTACKHVKEDSCADYPRDTRSSLLEILKVLDDVSSYQQDDTDANNPQIQQDVMCSDDVIDPITAFVSKDKVVIDSEFEHLSQSCDSGDSSLTSKLLFSSPVLQDFQEASEEFIADLDIVIPQEEIVSTSFCDNEFSFIDSSDDSDLLSLKSENNYGSVTHSIGNTSNVIIDDYVQPVCASVDAGHRIDKASGNENNSNSYNNIVGIASPNFLNETTVEEVDDKIEAGLHDNIADANSEEVIPEMYVDEGHTLIDTLDETCNVAFDVVIGEHDECYDYSDVCQQATSTDSEPNIDIVIDSKADPYNVVSELVIDEVDGYCDDSETWHSSGDAEQNSPMIDSNRELQHDDQMCCSSLGMNTDEKVTPQTCDDDDLMEGHIHEHLKEIGSSHLAKTSEDANVICHSESDELFSDGDTMMTMSVTASNVCPKAESCAALVEPETEEINNDVCQDRAADVFRELCELESNRMASDTCRKSRDKSTDSMLDTDGESLLVNGINVSDDGICNKRPFDHIKNLGDIAANKTDNVLCYGRTEALFEEEPGMENSETAYEVSQGARKYKESSNEDIYNETVSDAYFYNANQTDTCYLRRQTDTVIESCNDICNKNIIMPSDDVPVVTLQTSNDVCDPLGEGYVKHDIAITDTCTINIETKTHCFFNIERGMNGDSGVSSIINDRVPNSVCGVSTQRETVTGTCDRMTPLPLTCDDTCIKDATHGGVYTHACETVKTLNMMYKSKIADQVDKMNYVDHHTGYNSVGEYVSEDEDAYDVTMISPLSYVSSEESLVESPSSCVVFATPLLDCSVSVHCRNSKEERLVEDMRQKTLKVAIQHLSAVLMDDSEKPLVDGKLKFEIKLEQVVNLKSLPKEEVNIENVQKLGIDITSASEQDIEFITSTREHDTDIITSTPEQDTDIECKQEEDVDVRNKHAQEVHVQTKPVDSMNIQKVTFSCVDSSELSLLRDMSKRRLSILLTRTEIEPLVPLNNSCKEVELYQKNNKQNDLFNDLSLATGVCSKDMSSSSMYMEELAYMESLGMNCDSDENGRNYIKCYHCNTEVKNTFRLQCHWSHSCRYVNQEYRCEHCLLGFTTDSELKAHKCSMDKRQPFTCTFNVICDFKAKKASELERHTWEHLKYKPYRCQHCTFATVWKKNLRSHLINYHKFVLPYKCQTCGYEASYWHAIQKHKKYNCSNSRDYDRRQKSITTTVIHRGAGYAIKNWIDDSPKLLSISCEMCGRQFVNDSDRISHLYTTHHTINTSKHITNSKNVLSNTRVRHEKVKTSVSNSSMDERFKCNFCRKTFAKRSALNAHEYKMHKCKLCAFVAKYRSSLSKHMQRHVSKHISLGEKPQRVPVNDISDVKCSIHKDTPDLPPEIKFENLASPGPPELVSIERMYNTPSKQYHSDVPENLDETPFSCFSPGPPQLFPIYESSGVNGCQNVKDEYNLIQALGINDAYKTCVSNTDNDCMFSETNKSQQTSSSPEQHFKEIDQKITHDKLSPHRNTMGRNVFSLDLFAADSHGSSRQRVTSFESPDNYPCLSNESGDLDNGTCDKDSSDSDAQMDMSEEHSTNRNVFADLCMGSLRDGQSINIDRTSVFGNTNAANTINAIAASITAGNSSSSSSSSSSRIKAIADAASSGDSGAMCHAFEDIFYNHGFSQADTLAAMMRLLHK